MAMLVSIRKLTIATISIIVLLLLSTGLIYAQEKLAKVYNKADKLFLEAEALFNSAHPTAESDKLALLKYEEAKLIYSSKSYKTPRIASINLNIGVLYQSNNQNKKALYYYLSALNLRKKLATKPDSSFFDNYVYIGDIYYNLNNFDSAYYYYSQAEQLTTLYPSIQDIERLYNSIGALFHNKGNYKQSINYLDRALSSLKLSKTSTLQQVVNCQINIAALQCRVNRYQEAINSYKEIFKLKKFPIILYQNIAYTYFKIGEYDSSLVYLKKINQEEYDVINKIKLYNNLGNTYLKVFKPDQALSNFIQAIKINKESFHREKDISLAVSYLGLGQLYESSSQWQLALQQYQQAIISLHYTFSDQRIQANPKEFNNTVSSLYLFEALKHKAHALQSLYSETGHVSDLEVSLHTYQTAIRLADEIRKSYDSDEAKLFFTNTIYPVYEEAIQTAFQLYTKTNKPAYCEEAFALAEQSKAAILSETLHDLEIKQIPGIPASLVKKEKELKQQLTRLNIKLNEAHDTNEIGSLRNQIRDGEIALARTIRKFEDNKAYYQLKYAPHSAKIPEIQRTLLDDQTALIEYFVGKNQLYTFVITSTGHDLVATPLDKDFQRSLSLLNQALRQPAEGIHYEGHPYALNLYHRLITPIKSALEDKERLIIIPDAELSYLPFEVLVSQREEPRYLIEDFHITYAYSGTLLQNALQQPSDLGSGTLLAMAPFATAGKSAATRAESFGGLIASRAEVQDLGGDIWIGPRATKALFLKTAGSYGVIHLATHAKADNDEPLKSYISFFPHNKDSASDYRLYAQELYNLSLQSVKLVVLSACETSDGQWVRGEGIMSLARAFAYAGCPNIVTTLWKADDRSTADITILMHAYLKKGYEKDAALRQAKLDYLRSDRDNRLKAPYYWANLVFIGNNAPIYPSSFPYVWLVLGFITLVALAILRFYYQRKKQKSTRAIVSAPLQA